jgi:hypothetical protein
MKSRHAAAFALVGWYLMVPPLTSPGSEKYDTQAPLSRWQMLARFDSTAECTARQTQLMRDAAIASLSPQELRSRGITTKEYDAAKSRAFAEIGMYRCVSSDDPRLKRN